MGAAAGETDRVRCHYPLDDAGLPVGRPADAVLAPT